VLSVMGRALMGCVCHEIENARLPGFVRHALRSPAPRTTEVEPSS
jgi:hypothetical protein